MRIIGLTKQYVLWFFWLIEGIIVGFGAILPGISGGTLCVAFGMYRPAIETLTNIKSGIRKHGFMLGVFIIGGAIGFIGLSGFAAFLMNKNTVLVTCAFIGFIVGTMPELWNDAGAKGRTSSSYISLVCGFAVMIVILFILKAKLSVTVSADIWGFVLCGLLWGLSFIVPGLSSSSLLLFFGLYQPMLKGIYELNLAVLIPMGIGFIVCVLLLSKAVGWLYKKFYSVISHAVLGIVAATAVMILPNFKGPANNYLVNVLLILAGAIVSFCFTYMCNKLKNKIRAS